MKASGIPLRLSFFLELHAFLMIAFDNEETISLKGVGLIFSLSDFQDVSLIVKGDTRVDFRNYYTL